MPSRKRAKGKARKFAKEAKVAEAAKESQAVVEVATNQRQEGSLEVRIQGLIVNVAFTELCRHGCPQLSPDNKICREFIDAFIAAFLSQDSFSGALLTATAATSEEFVEIYSHKNLDTVVSMLVCRGINSILDERNRLAQLYASLACYFEDYIAVCKWKTRAPLNMTKLAELYDADYYTLVSFYRKRIPCACLDQKYKEV